MARQLTTGVDIEKSAAGESDFSKASDRQNGDIIVNKILSAGSKRDRLIVSI